MRGVFLDFDGVGHPVSAIEDWRDLNVHGADLPTLIAKRNLFRWLPILTEELRAHEDVVIFVHSGWRSVADNLLMRQILGDLGDRYMGITPLDLRRYAGIREVAQRAGLDQFLIIDDAKHEFPAECAELLLTDPELGLSEVAVQERLRGWLEATAPTESSAPAMAA